MLCRGINRGSVRSTGKRAQREDECTSQHALAFQAVSAGKFEGLTRVIPAAVAASTPVGQAVAACVATSKRVSCGGFGQRRRRARITARRAQLILAAQGYRYLRQIGGGYEFEGQLFPQGGKARGVFRSPFDPLIAKAPQHVVGTVYIRSFVLVLVLWCPPVLLLPFIVENKTNRRWNVVPTDFCRNEYGLHFWSRTHTHVCTRVSACCALRPSLPSPSLRKALTSTALVEDD